MLTKVCNDVTKSLGLLVRQPKPVLGVNLLLSGIVFFMIDYKRVRHAFSENAG